MYFLFHFFLPVGLLVLRMAMQPFYYPTYKYKLVCTNTVLNHT
jgi:hypothetical protein